LRQIVVQFVYNSPLPLDVLRDLQHIRRRMETEVGKESEKQFHFKAGAGGLLDVEFATQLLQLKNGNKHSGLRHSNTQKVLRGLAGEGLLKKEWFLDLNRGYEFLRLLENRWRLSAPLSSTAIARSAESLDRLARLCRFEKKITPESGGRFEKHYLEITQKVRQAYQAVVESLVATEP
jgi:[glutamine synthetase] adenylyltransferase / [glutamine synthetase]-adenylyl-L-tyrosine phosphorylase